MKQFCICSFLMMLVAAILAFSSDKDESMNTSDGMTSFGNFSLKVTGSGEKFSVVMADFDLLSGEETNGEIKILVDGQQMVNNRIIVKKGDTHYSLEFMVPLSEEDHILSARADLTINGKAADMTNCSFGMSPQALAGTDSGSY